MADLNAQVAASLHADSALVALVGDQIWNLRRPEINDKPALVYRRMSTIPVNSSQGANALAGASFQFDAYATTLESAAAIAQAARSAMVRDFQSPSEGRNDLYLPIECAYRVSIDMSIWGLDE